MDLGSSVLLSYQDYSVFSNTVTMCYKHVYLGSEVL